MQNEEYSRPANEERLSRKKKIRRRKRIRKLIVAFGFMIVFALVAAPIVIFGVFRVKTIHLRGHMPYTNAELYDACPIKVGDNLIFADFEKAAEVMETKLPYLTGTVITRTLPNTITITGETATEKAAVELSADRTYLLLDENLRIMKTFGYIPETAVVFKTPEPASREKGEKLSFVPDKDENGVDKNENLTDSMLEIIAELEDEKIFDKTDYVDLRNLDDIRIVYDGRIMMKLGSASDLAGKIELGAQVIEQENQISSIEKGTMDLSIAKKAYFEPDFFDDGTQEKPEPETGENGEIVTGEDETAQTQGEENGEDEATEENSRSYYKTYVEDREQ